MVTSTRKRQAAPPLESLELGSALATIHEVPIEDAARAVLGPRPRSRQERPKQSSLAIFSFSHT